MNVAELFFLVERQGIKLEAIGDRLRFFPRSAVTPDLLEQLIRHKDELLEMLEAKAERMAIQWCETAPKPDIRKALETALAEWDALTSERTGQDDQQPIRLRA